MTGGLNGWGWRSCGFAAAPFPPSASLSSLSLSLRQSSPNMQDYVVSYSVASLVLYTTTSYA